MTPEGSLQRMRAASHNLYYEATRTNFHPFIEMVALMNEFINICEENLAQGIDFTYTSTYPGYQLKIMAYEVNDLNEKLRCIFPGLIVIEGVKDD